MVGLVDSHHKYLAKFCTHCGQGLIEIDEKKQGIHITCYKQTQWKQYPVLTKKFGSSPKRDLPKPLEMVMQIVFVFADFIEIIIIALIILLLIVIFIFWEADPSNICCIKEFFFFVRSSYDLDTNRKSVYFSNWHDNNWKSWCRSRSTIHAFGLPIINWILTNTILKVKTRCFIVVTCASQGQSIHESKRSVINSCVSLAEHLILTWICISDQWAIKTTYYSARIIC